MPEKADSILAVQRSRILNNDELRKFDFISRACTSDTIALDNLFAQLKSAENRRIEPYAERLLYYLNHPLRADYSVKYIRPALELLQEVQLTGDIFFPAGWLKSLLKAHHSEAAKEAIENFLRDNPNYPELLRNKILQAAYLPEPFETKNDY
jgi:aminopeptidase N